MIFDKAKLLSVFDMTKDAEPMKTGNPSPDIPVPSEVLDPVGPGPRDRTILPPIQLPRSLSAPSA
jgi:hypothetical protein